MIRKVIRLAGLPIAALLAACSGPESSDARIVFTSILPQRDFVRHIAGERFAVDALVGPGQSPASYEPSLEQMKQLSGAAVFFRIGVPFEEGIMHKIQASMPNVHIVDLRAGIVLRDMTEEHHHDDDHSDHGDHEAAHHEHDGEPGHEEHHDKHQDAPAQHGKDPHIWLSPPLVKQMAVIIRDALVEIDPAGKQVFDQNLGLFHRRLDSLDAYIRTTLAPLKGTELFVFHPAFGYFADEYGLTQKPVETGGKEPSARDLAELVEEAREHEPKVIFVQPQFAQKSARALAEQIGCAVVPINPLPEDYFAEMRDMCAKIHAGLSGDG
jgi:zinc transport system substrate-binding protein